MSITIEESATPWETQKYRNCPPGKIETHVSVSTAIIGSDSPKKVRSSWGREARKIAAESLAQGVLERS
jgi:hypothetical protein